MSGGLVWVATCAACAVLGSRLTHRLLPKVRLGEYRETGFVLLSHTLAIHEIVNQYRTSRRGAPRRPERGAHHRDPRGGHRRATYLVGLDRRHELVLPVGLAFTDGSLKAFFPPPT